MFFSGEAQTSNLGMDTAVADNSIVLNNLGSDLVQLGRSMERLDNPIPVRDATTTITPGTGRKKKLAVGQKEDDHESQEFNMSM